MGVKNLDLASFLRREKPYSQNQCIKTKIELAWLALQSVRVIRYHLLQKHDHWVIGVYKPWNSISLRCAHLSIPTACRSHPNTSSLHHLTPHSKGQNWYSEGREPASPLRGNTFSSIPHLNHTASEQPPTLHPTPHGRGQNWSSEGCKPASSRPGRKKSSSKCSRQKNKRCL